MRLVDQTAAKQGVESVQSKPAQAVLESKATEGKAAECCDPGY